MTDQVYYHIYFNHSKRHNGTFTTLSELYKHVSKIAIRMGFIDKLTAHDSRNRNVGSIVQGLKRTKTAPFCWWNGLRFVVVENTSPKRTTGTIDMSTTAPRHVRSKDVWLVDLKTRKILSHLSVKDVAAIADVSTRTVYAALRTIKSFGKCRYFVTDTLKQAAHVLNTNHTKARRVYRRVQRITVYRHGGGKLGTYDSKAALMLDYPEIKPKTLSSIIGTITDDFEGVLTLPLNPGLVFTVDFE